jgi:hypothetical protein
VTPWDASHCASPSTSAGGRETNAPRKVGMAQNEQRRSQPDASFSAADGPDARRLRRSQSWPGIDGAPPSPAHPAAVAAVRCTGLMGSRVRRSRGVCGTSGRPSSTSSSRSPMLP